MNEKTGKENPAMKRGVLAIIIVVTLMFFITATPAGAQEAVGAVEINNAKPVELARNDYGVLEINSNGTDGSLVVLNLTSKFNKTETLDILFGFSNSSNLKMIPNSISVFDQNTTSADSQSVLKNAGYSTFKNRNWYKVEKVEWEANETRVIKFQPDIVPRLGTVTGEYDILIKRSSDSFEDIVKTGEYLYVDPWWSATWTVKNDIYLSSIKDDTATTHTNEYVEADVSGVTCKDTTNKSDLRVVAYNNTTLGYKWGLWNKTVIFKANLSRTIYTNYSVYCNGTTGSYATLNTPQVWERANGGKLRGDWNTSGTVPTVVGTGSPPNYEGTFDGTPMLKTGAGSLYYYLDFDNETTIGNVSYHVSWVGRQNNTGAALGGFAMYNNHSEAAGKLGPRMLFHEVNGRFYLYNTTTLTDTSVAFTVDTWYKFDAIHGEGAGNLSDYWTWKNNGTVLANRFLGERTASWSSAGFYNPNQMFVDNVIVSSDNFTSYWHEGNATLGTMETLSGGVAENDTISNDTGSTQVLFGANASLVLRALSPNLWVNFTLKKPMPAGVTIALDNTNGTNSPDGGDWWNSTGVLLNGSNGWWNWTVSGQNLTGNNTAQFWLSDSANLSSASVAESILSGATLLKNITFNCNSENITWNTYCNVSQNYTCKWNESKVFCGLGKAVDLQLNITANQTENITFTDNAVLVRQIDNKTVNSSISITITSNAGIMNMTNETEFNFSSQTSVTTTTTYKVCNGPNTANYQLKYINISLVGYGAGYLTLAPYVTFNATSFTLASGICKDVQANFTPITAGVYKDSVYMIGVATESGGTDELGTPLVYVNATITAPSGGGSVEGDGGGSAGGSAPVETLSECAVSIKPSTAVFTPTKKVLQVEIINKEATSRVSTITIRNTTFGITLKETPSSLPPNEPAYATLQYDGDFTEDVKKTELQVSLTGCVPKTISVEARLQESIFNFGNIGSVGAFMTKTIVGVPVWLVAITSIAAFAGVLVLVQGVAWLVAVPLSVFIALIIFGITYFTGMLA